METRLWRTCLAAALGAAACAPPPDYLYVDPHVAPVRVEVRRSFGVIQKHYEPVPITECGFYEATLPADAKASAYTEELWRVVSPTPDVATQVLRYGIVPRGFVQATPAAGPPPPLEPGKRYTVECSGDARGLGEFEMPARTTRRAPPLQKRD
jgi:hypothetical protein